MDADIQRKFADKWDPELANEVLSWVQAVTGETITDMQEDLKSGILLCKYAPKLNIYLSLVNRIKPGIVARISTMSAPFKQRVTIQT